MTRFEPRTLLASLAGAVGLAGCSGDDRTSSTERAPAATADSLTPMASRTPPETGKTTESPTPTDRAASSPIDASDLEFVVSVVRQPSEAAWDRVRASLTDDSGEARSFAGGDPLPVTATVTDGPNENLLLFPRQIGRLQQLLVG